MTSADLRAWLKLHHLTARTACQLLGVKRRAVEHWLSGRRSISPETAILCAMWTREFERRKSEAKTIPKCPGGLGL